MKDGRESPFPLSSVWLFIFDLVTFACGAVVVLAILQLLGLPLLR